jgi:hypothetical protein
MVLQLSKIDKKYKKGEKVKLLPQRYFWMASFKTEQKVAPQVLFYSNDYVSLFFYVLWSSSLTVTRK